MADRLRIFVVGQQVGRDARGPGDEHAAEADPFAVIEVTVVEPDISSSGLASDREGELVPVGGEMAEPEYHGRRAVRDDSLVRASLPCQDPGRELEPCCPQVQVVGQGRAGEVTHAVGDAFQYSPVSNEPVEGGWGGASALSLAPRDETPLILGDLSIRARHRGTGQIWPGTDD